ncbi:MAG: hypothetical protein QM692_17845 [Thermomicrobiales bacterium]
MRVSAIEIIEQRDTCQLQGWVTSDAGQFSPFLLWYRYPAELRPYVHVDNGDPFLAALLTGAMLRGEDLTIEAPVSPRLLEALPELQAILGAFEPRSRQITVHAPPRQYSLPAPAEAPGAGLFFSLGVDSFYSLLKNRRDYPAGERRLTHLLTLHGIDQPGRPWQEEFAPQFLANAQRVAVETGTQLVPIVSNVRRVIAVLGTWPPQHGGALLAAALGLGGFLRRIYIAASTTYDRLYPWGSHPLLDPLWSTETLTVIHDGCELNTIDKTRVIAELRPDLVMPTLRPCAGYGPAYNCGGCEKCLRTMLDLLGAGYLAQCETLPHTVDLRQLQMALRPGGPVHIADYTRRLRALEALGVEPAAQQVLREHLAGGMDRKWLADATRSTPPV